VHASSAEYNGIDGTELAAMMNVLSAAEMETCDRATSEQFGIPSIDLMRAASAAVARFARLHFPRARRVTVLCGRGNNGGDGMMTARLLAEAGLEVTTVLAGSPEGITGDAAVAWRELNSPIHGRVAVTAPEEFTRHNEVLNCDLLIDALLGTGFKPPMKGLALAALEWTRSCTAPILAVDLPSGWAANSTCATCDGPVFPADAVVTFTAPKPAHVFGELTRRWDQPIVVASIGSPQEAIISAQQLSWAGASLELVQRPRVADANKGKFGHVLAVGGTFGSAGGKSGAPAMVSLAALRSGAGLVTAAVPAPALAAVASFIPELMTWPLDATSDGHIAASNATPDRIAAFATGKTVLAIGPGMGQSEETAKFLFDLLRATNMPAVLDADALNILAAHKTSLAELAQIAKSSRTLVLTPHPGEMARLAGISTAEVQASRLETARSFAQRNGVTLVLKGARTLIAHPDGQIAVNTSGNPGMAKGGSGDLLTGFIAGILAQHSAEPARAVEAAVYLHGLAADSAVHATDEHTLLATDSLRFLSHAFQFQSFHFRKTAPSDYVWLQGHCIRPDAG
jgi:ADP-dependent NAD(P)H-hydrate dehydratase / NAD(P)H-hydrate epimerase